MAATGVAFEVAEAILAHTTNSVVAAYLRDPMLERRRPVMQRWADHVTGNIVDNVIELRSTGA